MTTWSLQDAQTRFEDLIEHALTSGPQVIAADGVELAVVLSITDYSALAAARPDFKAHLLGGPKVDDFEIPRD
jgi:prevent-host-death family protein